MFSNAISSLSRLLKTLLGFISFFSLHILPTFCFRFCFFLLFGVVVIVFRTYSLFIYFVLVSVYLPEQCMNTCTLQFSGFLPGCCETNRYKIQIEMKLESFFLIFICILVISNSL